MLLLLETARAGDVVVDMLDIGQGDSILIRTPAAKTILIDAGDRGTDVVSQLVALGVDHLDMAIATHPHADHVGSMEAVLRAFPPKLYLDSGLAHTTSLYNHLMEAIEANVTIGYKSAAAGSVYNLDDGAKIEVLLPNPGKLFTGTRSDLNSNSVVTRLTHGKDCFLFMGDAEEPTERALVEQNVGRCEVLKVAHHGSNHSSSQAFVEAVRPSIALISAGVANRYNHPGTDTLGRLASVAAKVYRTDLEGRITVVSTGSGVKVSTQRKNTGVPLVAVAAATIAVTPSPAAQAGAAATCPYPGSRKSEVFHEAGCGNALKITEGNLVCQPTREAAIASGKRAAGCCDP